MTNTRATLPETFSVRLPTDLHRRVKVLAAQTDRTLSEVAADAVRDYLARHDNGQ